MKPLPNTVTIITAAWGNYWEKHGNQFTENISKLDPYPSEVIVVSDRPIDTNFRVIIESDLHLGMFRNAGIKNSTSDWIVLADLDDTQYVNYIDELDYNYDIISFSLIKPDGKISKGSAKKWKNLFDISARNAVVGTSAVKKELISKILYRKVGWEDWVLWLDCKRAGATVKFDNTIRGLYNQSNTGLCSIDVEKKNQEVLEIKKNENWPSNE
jgi:glycosyltransferase involved in cell wall biosynthesis